MPAVGHLGLASLLGALVEEHPGAVLVFHRARVLVHVQQVLHGDLLPMAVVLLDVVGDLEVLEQLLNLGAVGGEALVLSDVSCLEM